MQSTGGQGIARAELQVDFGNEQNLVYGRSLEIRPSGPAFSHTPGLSGFQALLIHFRIEAALLFQLLPGIRSGPNLLA
jgi:hypothetical protein